MKRNIQRALLFGLFCMVLSFAGCGMEMNWQLTGDDSDEDPPPPPPPPPTISINDAGILEGDAPGTVNLTFTVTISNAPLPGRDVAIDWTTADGTAQDESGDGDYTAANGSLSFTSVGPTTQQIQVAVNRDNIPEPDEAFYIDLSNGVNVTINDGQGVGTIANDDLIDLSIDDVSMVEGAALTTVNFVFTVTADREPAVGYDASVDWGTANGTAQDENGNNDYTSASGTLTFVNGGPLSQQLIVVVNGDDVLEADQYFNVNLSGPVNAGILDGQGIGTIERDEPGALTISNASLTEGAAATTGSMVFTVSISPEPFAGQDAVVDWATADGTAEDETGDGDYSAAGGTLTFTNGGPLSQTLTVQINGDNSVEFNEVFYIDLSNPANASISDGQGLGTIINDDLINMSIDDVTMVEGSGVGTVDFVFTVSIDQGPPIGADVTVDWQTADFTAEDEFGDNDYSSAAGSLIFVNGGPLSQQITIVANSDDMVEGDEVFYVNLFNNNNALLADGQGAGTIERDESGSVSISDASVAEGAALGTVSMDFTVSVWPEPLAGQDVTIDWATADDTAEDENGDGDYDSAGGTLTFTEGGPLTQTVSVQIKGDDIVEDDESLFVDLSNPVNAGMLDAQGVGVIMNDDWPVVTFGDIAMSEGDRPGYTQMVFTVSLSVEPAPAWNTSMDWATADGTAEDENGNRDYIADAGTLTFVNGGGTTQQIAVMIVGDDRAEFAEDFFVDLANSANCVINDARAVGTILPDDQGIYIDDATAAEGQTAENPAAVLNVSVLLDPAAGNDVTVDWATADDTAEDENGDNDYTSAGGSLTFTNGGPLTQQVTVILTGDDILEPDQYFYVALSNPVNASLVGGRGVGTIMNDDGIVRLVDPTSDAGPEDGLTWGTAYHTIQIAVDAAELAGGGEVWIAADTYDNGGADDSPVFRMKSGVHVCGGFEGYDGGSGAQETSRLSRDWLANETILDGLDWAENVVVGADSASLNGFTVTRGNANTADLGGGMFNDQCAPVITNCIFRDNRADEGGGIYNLRAAVYIRNCRFEDNEGYAYGGGLYNFDCDPVIKDCFFTGNWTTREGGAVFNESADPIMEDCVFEANWTTPSTNDLGGAFSNLNSSPIIRRCLFKFNESGEEGGAIYNEGGSPQFKDCVFDRNFSNKLGGGAAYNLNSTASFENCLFKRNSAYIAGGAIYNRDSNTVFTNCIFVANSVEHTTQGDGGGMVNRNCSPTVTNCTFFGNKAFHRGGGIYNSVFASPTLINCIVWGNEAPLGSNVFNDIVTNPCIPDVSNCIVGGSGGSAAWDSYFGTDNGGNLDEDPQLIDPEGMDGIVGTEDDDLRLLLSSPGTDGGTSVGAPATDFAGTARPAGAGYDIGAYEDPVSYPGRTVFVDDTAVGSDNGNSWTDAYTSIQIAIATCQAGDEVWVAEGVYRLDFPDSVLLRMKHGIDIYGGFAGTESTVGERGDPAATPSILDGQNICKHVVMGASNALLDGFTITNGNADGEFFEGKGGGLIARYSSPALANCIFLNNSAAYIGGGIFAEVSTLTISECTFTNNSSLDQLFGVSGGGGIFMRRSNGRLTDSKFEGNYAKYDGAGIRINRDEGVSTGRLVEIENCLFLGNITDGSGGAVGIDVETTHIRNSIFRGNIAWNRGGAIQTEGNTVDVQIWNCVFSKNRAGDGGAISTEGPYAVIGNCLFEGNYVWREGGALSNHHTAIVENCTFAYNLADQKGGAVFNDDEYPLQSADNCIFWANIARISDPQIGIDAATFDVSYSNIQGSYPGVGNINTDPLFANVPLRTDWTSMTGTITSVNIINASLFYSVNDVIEIDDDGIARVVTTVTPTSVIFAPALAIPSDIYTPVENWGPGAVDLVIDLTLLAGSPCLDAGDNAAVPADAADLDDDGDTAETVPWDHAGNSRFVDDAAPDTGNGPAPIVDMGAYEK